MAANRRTLPTLNPKMRFRNQGSRATSGTTELAYGHEGFGAIALKVFISWSGERSKEMANALREWLPMVLQYVEPFVSDKDISAG